MSGYFYGEKATNNVNFLDSETGLILKTCQVDGTGVEADEYGNKIIKAGTIYPADDSTAKGIIFTDVNVTHGEKTASLLVAGRVLNERLNISDEAVAALQAVGITFVDVPIISRTIVYDLGYTAGAGSFSAEDIAQTDDGTILTITAVGNDNDTAICTVELDTSTNEVSVTEVTAGTTQVTVTVTDIYGSTSDITVPVAIL